GGHAHDRLVQPQAAGRAGELGVAVGEDAAVGGHEPVALRRAGGGLGAAPDAGKGGRDGQGYGGEHAEQAGLETVAEHDGAPRGERRSSPMSLFFEGYPCSFSPQDDVSDISSGAPRLFLRCWIPPPAIAWLKGVTSAGTGARRGADMPAVRCAAVLRLALILGAVTAGSFGDHSGPARNLFVVLGLVGVPWATLVLFAADRPGSPWAVVGGPAGDLAALFAVHWSVPAAADAVLVGYVVVVAFAGYTAGRTVAGPLAVAAVLLAVAAEDLGPGAGSLGTGAVTALAAAVLALVVLLDRTVELQNRAAADSTRLAGKADAILARVADSVVVTDSAGCVRECNPAAERLVGLPLEQVVGRTCAEVLGLRVDDLPLDCSRRCGLLGLASADGARPHETWRLDAAGRPQPLLANAEAVVDDRGRTVEVVHSLRDITRLKQAEEAKTLFLATASHELKTPLTVIRGFADTLLAFDDFDPDRRTAALQAIRIRSEELVRIVDRLLLSSRIEAGRVQVNPVRLELAPLLLERVLSLRAATGRPIELQLDDAVPDVSADGSALASVVDHLLDNALKYSPGGEPVAVRA